MPRCEGIPTGPCPKGRNDNTVKLGEGDLMLCVECDKFRHDEWLANNGISVSTNKKADDLMPSCAAPNIHDTMTNMPSVSVAQEKKNNAPLDQKVSVATGKSDTGATSFANTGKAKLIACELLCFAVNKLDNHPLSVLRSVILEFFREDEIFSSKQLLVQLLDPVHHSVIGSFNKRRIGECKIERTVDDILNSLKYVDENNLRNELPTFCVVSLDRLPSIPDEMSDLCSIKQHVSHLTLQVEQLSKQLSSIMPAIATQSNNSNISKHTMQLGSVDKNKEVMDLPTEPDEEPLTVVATQNEHTEQAVMVDQSAQLHSAVMLSDTHPSYSTVAATPPMQEDFQMQERRRRKPKVVVGRNTVNTRFSGVCKKAVVCVNRLESSLTTDMITDHLKDAGIPVVSCFKIVRNKGDTQSDEPQSPGAEPRFCLMRLCIPEACLSKVMSEDLWPHGVVVRRWVFKRDVTNGVHM